MKKFEAPFLIELYSCKKYIGTIFTTTTEYNEVMEQVRCEYMNFKTLIMEKKCKKK